MSDSEVISQLIKKIQILEERITELEMLNFHAEWNRQMKIAISKDKPK